MSINELDELIVQAKQQAETCAKNAVVFKRKFRFLGWAAVAFVIFFTPWSIALIVAGVASQPRWLSVLSGAFILGLAVHQACMSQQHFRCANKLFRQFMELRAEVLSNLKEMREFRDKL